MRRARIKALATVPVRRKNVSQENENGETKSTTSKPPDKQPEDKPPNENLEKERPLNGSLIKEKETDSKSEDKIESEEVEEEKVVNGKENEIEIKAVNSESTNEVIQREVPKLAEVVEKSTNGFESDEEKKKKKEEKESTEKAEESVRVTNKPRIVNIESIDRESVIKLTEKNNNTETIVESEKVEKENIRNLKKENEIKEQSVTELVNSEKKDLQTPSNYLEGENKIQLKKYM